MDHFCEDCAQYIAERDNALVDIERITAERDRLLELVGALEAANSFGHVNAAEWAEKWAAACDERDRLREALATILLCLDIDAKDIRASGGAPPKWWDCTIARAALKEKANDHYR